jgi:hypothetical protein
MYAGTNRAGVQKTPVTLRDNTNERGGPMYWVSDSIILCTGSGSIRTTRLERSDSTVNQGADCQHQTACAFPGSRFRSGAIPSMGLKKEGLHFDLSW